MYLINKLLFLFSCFFAVLQFSFFQIFLQHLRAFSKRPHIYFYNIREVIEFKKTFPGHFIYRVIIIRSILPDAHQWPRPTLYMDYYTKIIKLHFAKLISIPEKEEIIPAFPYLNWKL